MTLEVKCHPEDINYKIFTAVFTANDIGNEARAGVINDWAKNYINNCLVMSF